MSIMSTKSEVAMRPIGRTVHIHIGDRGLRVLVLELRGREGIGVLQREQEVIRIRIVESVTASRNNSNGGIRPEEIVILIFDDVDDRPLVVDKRVERLGSHRIRFSREDAFPLPLSANPLHEGRCVFFV